MGGVIDWVQDEIIDPIVDVVEDIGNAVVDVVDFVVDEIVEPVVEVVGNTIDSMLDDPIKTIAQIAVLASGPQNYWMLPLIEGADVAIAGGDLGDVLEATAKAYVAQEIGSAVGSKVSNSVYANQAGVQAGVQTANEAIAAEVIGRASGSAAAAVVTGKDPLQAFVTGGVSAGVPAVLGQVDGFTDLPPSAQRAISSAVTAKALGRDIDATAIASMVAATELTTRTLKAYDPDGTKLTNAERALAADMLYATTSAAIQGGNVSEAIQKQLIKVGTKQLGDMVKSGFKGAVEKITSTYEAADANGMVITKNEADQKAIIDKYNAEKAKLDEKITEQDRLKADAEAKVAVAKQDPSNKANVDAANAATKAYNDYAKTVETAYNEAKPILDGYSEDLSNLQITHAELTDDYEGLIKSLAESTSPVQDKLDDIYFNTNKAFVGELDPNFDAEAYKKINNLGNDVDAYEHWLDKGQFDGLVTNDKDQKIVEARAKYKEATGQDLPERIVERARVTDIDNRDAIVENFVDTTLADNAAVQATTNKAVEQVLDAYDAAGLSQTEIKEKIDNGEANARANQIVAEQKQSVENLRDYAAAVAQEKGTDSAEFKAAYKNALEAMADVGGYGVSKDGDDFVTTGGGKLDLATNTEQFARPTARVDAAVDPVTGEVVFEGIRYDNEAGKLTDVAYSAVLAIGESAKPPKEGGGAYFGDGTGVSSGLFGGFYPIAFDDGSGNSGMLYQGDSGFSLITYSDGRSIVVKDTVLATPIDEKGEPPPGTIWAPDIVSVPPEVKEKILAEVPVVKEKTPEEKEALKAKLNEPPPATIADAKETIAKDTSEALDAAYQTPEEVTAALKAAGYNPTPEEAASMRGEKSAEQLRAEAQAYATPRTVTANEAKQFLEELGYNPTDEEVAQFVGQANDEAYKEQQKAASAEYAAPRMVTEAEARKALTDAGYNPTDEEVAQFVGQSNDIAYREQQIAAAGTYAAPRVVTFAEAKQALTDAGYNPTDEEVAQFVGQANDANYQEQQIAASGAYAAPRVVTFDEAKKALTDAGYNPTDEEVAQFVGQANDANYQANQQTAAGEYADPRVVDEGEAKAAYAALGLKKPTADDIKALMGQYEETGLTEKAKANLDNARYNSIMAQLDDLTVGASQETLDTIELVKADLTKQVTNLGFKIDKTAEDLTGAIGDVKTNVLAKIAENEAAGLTRDEATQKAIADVAADLGTTTSAISAQIGTPASVDAEGNPVAATGIYAGLTDISTDLKESEARVTSDVRAVADLVGKPASEVTQGDIDYVKQFLSGGGGGQADLTYDYNGDGVVDINDQTALEGIVGGAGEGSPFAPAAGSKWAATGIYGTLDANSAAAQKAIAEEAERTRAANARLASANRNAAAQQAQRTQRMGNLNTMMGMLGQSNDIGGQQVTVKPADPAKIGYVYDFDSIFANPTQEKMFASPYGNYAEGGMVEDDVNAELIKMLRS
jgi:hypothetical protein